MAELHFDPPKSLDMSGPWYRDMRSYHWFVLIVAALGWLFDCLDQQLFVLARPAAMRDLLGVRKDVFEDYSTKLKSAIPSGLTSTPVDTFLERSQKQRGRLRRDEFWPIANELKTKVASSKTDAELAMATITALDRLPEIADQKKFDALVGEYSGYVTAIFLLGWATGGLVFGVMGDRYGRAKTMLITILLYSAFTGLSSLSTGFWDFSLYRFLTGLGVGGEFAVGVALVAEVMPDRARPATLTLLQMLSALGNMTAALINMKLGVMESEGLVSSPWRIMFLIGALPALLAVVVRWKLKEPERWKELSAEQAINKQMGSYRALFNHPVWRKHALIGLMLAFSGVVGLWAVGFFTPDLTKRVLRDKITVSALSAEFSKAKDDAKRTDALLALVNENIDSATQQKNVGLTAQLEELKTNLQPASVSASNTNAGNIDAGQVDAVRATIQKTIDGDMTYWGGVSSIFIQIGAFFGMFGFGYVAQKIGRKPTFAIAFITAGLSTAMVYKYLSDFSQIFWMLPMMGFFQLSLFAGYAVYFPELFPTALRSTGTSFCYNVGRFVAALGPFTLGLLNKVFQDQPEPYRYSGLVLCSIFLVGLLALPFAPETKGKPLPE